MSRKTKIAIAAGVLIAIGTAAAVSQTGGGHGRWMHGGGPHGDREGGRHGPMQGGFAGWFGRPLTKEAFDTRTRERFARIDRNSDGVIEAAEAEAAVTARLKDGKVGHHARMLERLGRQFDDDRDGRITRDEFLAGFKRRFAEMDLDRDGRITDADLPPMMRGRMALAESEFGLGKGKRRDRMGSLAGLVGADTNKDGVITADEASALAVKRFAWYDRNNDGVIDVSDAEALRAETVDYRVKRFLHHYGVGANGKVTREQFMAKANERFARLDRDKDGVISRSEMPGRGHRRHMGHGMGYGEHGKRGRGAGDGDPANDSRTGSGKGSGPQNAPGR